MSLYEPHPEEESRLAHVLDDVPEKNHTTSPIPVLPELGVALGLLVFVFSVTYIGATSTLTKNKERDDMRVEAKLVDIRDTVRVPTNAFTNTQVQAVSAIVWDVEKQKILFNKNADDVRPLASVAKLMTALIAYELLDPEEKVSISLRSLSSEGDSGFVDGEKFTMQKLSDLTLVSSSNDAATALSLNAGNTISAQRDPEEIFIKAMNLKAEELGLTKTHFANSTGLDLSPSEAGAYGSARDMALLMEYIITNFPDAVALTTVDMTTIKNENGEWHTAKNTNAVVNSINGLIASKTGYTELSGGNLVVAFNAGLNRPIIVVVLGSTEAGRFSDTLTLIERTRAYIEGSE